jgi:uncharacterized protein with HEPN domain
MQRDPVVYIQDALDAANSIETFLGEMDEIAFAQSDLVQSAVYYQFAIIGEALNNFSKIDPGQATAIVNLRNWVSFRNILTHAYHRVSSELVFNYAKQSLPALKSVIKKLIADATQV